VLELWNGIRMNLISKSSKWNQPAQLRKKGGYCKLNASGAPDLIGTTSITSFTRPTTFGRRHHPLLKVYYVILHKGYIQMAFFPEIPKWESQNWRFLLFWNFGHSYLFQIKPFWSIQAQYLISFKKIFSIVFYTPIKNHLIHALRGFVVKNQFPNLIPNPSFDHNLCILCLNKQCKGFLVIYTLKSFQWYPRGSIWCFLVFSTEALNIQNSHTSVTPKVGMHLGVIGFHFLHSPPFVTFSWLHGPLHSTLSCDVKVAIIWS
jgi:hypothetical protein